VRVASSDVQIDQTLKWHVWRKDERPQVANMTAFPFLFVFPSFFSFAQEVNVVASRGGSMLCSIGLHTIIGECLVSSFHTEAW
jgi:hypothetical protein